MKTLNPRWFRYAQRLRILCFHYAFFCLQQFFSVSRFYGFFTASVFKTLLNAAAPLNIKVAALVKTPNTRSLLFVQRLRIVCFHYAFFCHLQFFLRPVFMLFLILQFFRVSNAAALVKTENPR